MNRDLQNRKNIQEPVRAVIFDMDNTLFDFVEAQLSACRAVLDHLDMKNNAEDLFSYFRRPDHGFEHHDNIRDFLVDKEVFCDRKFHECCAIYEEEKVAAVTPYPGISRVLLSLTRIPLPIGIVTDAPSKNARIRLEKAGLHPFFKTIVTPDISGAVKPDPAAFRLALDYLGSRAEETVLVGDSIRRDIIPAKILGMVTVYAKYGDRYSQGQDVSRVPGHIAEKPADIGIILTRLVNSVY